MKKSAKQAISVRRNELRFLLLEKKTDVRSTNTTTIQRMGENVEQRAVASIGFRSVIGNVRHALRAIGMTAFSQIIVKSLVKQIMTALSLMKMESLIAKLLVESNLHLLRSSPLSYKPIISLASNHHQYQAASMYQNIRLLAL